MTMSLVFSKVYCQKDIHMNNIIEMEKESIKNFLSKKRNYKEIDVDSINLYGLSYHINRKKDSTYYKIFLEETIIKRILFFDKKYSVNEPIYGIEVEYYKQFRIFLIHTAYYKTKFDWKSKNYIGFIISDNKTGLNLFIGYSHYFGLQNSVEDIDRIFLLDNNFVTKKQLLFNSGILRYITEPVRIENRYKYEKSYKSENVRITGNTKIEYILQMLKVNFDTLNYKMLYMINSEENKKKPYRRTIYPLWSNYTVSYYPCWVLDKDDNENKVYFRRIYDGDTTVNMVIDNKIRGELECFDWVN